VRAEELRRFNTEDTEHCGGKSEKGICVHILDAADAEKDAWSSARI
jgi:hypothetical protein